MSGTPKTIRKIKENAYMNLSYKWIAVFVIWTSITVILTIPLTMINYGLYVKAFITAIILIWWSVYLKWFRNSDVVTRTLLIIKFILRGITGQTTIAKYDVKPAFLQNVVPVKEIHSHGIVEFTGKQYGKLFRMDPPRISEDDLESHVKRVGHVVNSLHGDLMLKTIVCSRVDIARGLKDDLLHELDDKTDAQREHLYNLYHETAENAIGVIDWQFYLFIGIGKHDNIEHASNMMQSQVPGLIKFFNRAGVHCVPISDKDEIALVYRQLFVQNKIIG